ncbi:MAG: hypothetical protein ACT4TC_13795 [Myxococcaceae bacterium]
MNAAQLERAAAALSQQGGLFSTRLVESGVGAAEVVTALARISGLTPAPVSSLRQPPVAVSEGTDARLWLKLLAAPFGRVENKLQIAFANPLAAQLPEAQALPPHVPYVALETEVRRCLLSLYGPERLGLPYVPRTPRPEEAAPEVASPPPETETDALHVTAEAPVLEDSAFGAVIERQGEYREVGGYTLIKPLASGSLGASYLARDGNGPEVVLSLFHAEQSTAASQFRRSAEQMIALRHDHVAPLVDFGDDGGRVFLVRDRAPSTRLPELIQKMGRLPPPLAAELFSQLLAALEFAHGHGVFHGALTCEHLSIGEDGKLRVEGLGEGALFAAAHGQTLDAPGDLHAAGLVLMQMLTGANLPREGRPPPLVFELEPMVPTVLETVVERLLARGFENALDVLGELRPYLDAQRELYPFLVTASLGNPERMQQQMRKDAAKACFQEARKLLDGGGKRNLVALMLYKATLLEPGESVAAQGLAAICQADRLQFGSSLNPRVAELEGEVAAAPGDSAKLQELAKLYRAEGNIFRALVCLKKDVRNHPTDLQLASQLAQLFEGRPTRAAGVTREINRVEVARTVEVKIQQPVDEEALLRVAQARGRRVVIAALTIALLLAGLVVLQWKLR